MPVALSENRTKHALDRALRQLLEHKKLDQIRVREVAELCAIRRQSFYYHFPDVYGLFDWSLQQEAERLLARKENCLTWQEALADLLNYTSANRPYYRAILENRGRAGLRKVLIPALEQSLEQTLDYYRLRCGIPRNPEADRTQQSCLETLHLSLIESWIQGDLPQHPGELIAALDTAISQSVMGAAWQNLPLQSP